MSRRKRSIESGEAAGRSNLPARGEDDLERQAKAIVLIAFRNGPLEDLHAGMSCSHCSEKQDFSKISDPEMRMLMKTAVNRVFTVLKLRDEQPDTFEGLLRMGDLFTKDWDPAEFTAKL